MCEEVTHVNVGVSKNNGNPKSSILIGFSIIFTIHFGFFPPIFGNIHVDHCDTHFSAAWMRPAFQKTLPSGKVFSWNWLEVAGFPRNEWKQTMLGVFGVNGCFFSMMDYPISGIALLFDVCVFSASQNPKSTARCPIKRAGHEMWFRIENIEPQRRPPASPTRPWSNPLELRWLWWDLTLTVCHFLLNCGWELCRALMSWKFAVVKNSSKALWDTLNRENTIWQKLCILHFPSMYSSVCTNPLGCPILSNVSSLQLGLQDQPMESPCCEETEMLQPPSAAQTLAIDWKMLFARRWQKQRKWERGRCKTQTSTAVTKRCTSCGELCDESGEMDCAIHPGDFLPRQTSDWSRVELQQLQSYARAAWRSIGGCTAIQRSARVYRGGGYWG